MAGSPDADINSIVNKNARLIVTDQSFYDFKSKCIAGDIILKVKDHSLELYMSQEDRDAVTFESPKDTTLYWKSY